MTFFFPLPSNSQMLLYHYHISFLLLLFIYFFFSHYLTYFSFFLKRRKSTYFSGNLLTFSFTLSITYRLSLDPRCVCCVLSLLRFLFFFLFILRAFSKQMALFITTKNGFKAAFSKLLTCLLQYICALFTDPQI